DLESGHLRHLDVQEHYVGLQPLYGFDCGRPVCRFARLRCPWHISDQRGKAAPGEGFVLDDESGEHPHPPPVRRAGIVSVTLNPACGRVSTTISALPAKCARS